MAEKNWPKRKGMELRWETLAMENEKQSVHAFGLGIFS